LQHQRRLHVPVTDDKQVGVQLRPDFGVDVQTPIGHGRQRERSARQTGLSAADDPAERRVGWFARGMNAQPAGAQLFGETPRGGGATADRTELIEAARRLAYAYEKAVGTR
jgi:hypothetical protein